jgi:hypothetical protein
MDHDGSLTRILASINTNAPNAGDIAALRVAEERLRLQELSAAHGFLPLPNGVLTGPYDMAFDATTGTVVRPTRAHLARTTTISGATGSGKTTLLHRIVRAALRDGINVWTIDAKNDAQYLAVEDERTLIIDSDAPLNLLQRPTFLSAPEHQAVFTTVLARSLYGGEHLKQIIGRAFEALGPNDTLEDLARHVEQGAAKNGTYAERDATRGGLLRLQRIGQLYPGLYRTRHGLPLEELFRRPMYLPVKIQTEVDEFFFAYLIHLLFLYQRSRAHRPELSHLIQMDEGILSWNRNPSTKIEGMPLLSYLQSMIREFGIGMLISTTSVHLLDPLLKSNTFTRIALNVTDHFEASEIARSFGLSDRQREYFQRGLTRGECIIKFADDWTHPILASYPRNTESKIVSPVAWETARQRTSALVPPPPLPVILTAAAREGTNGQPATVERPSPSAAHAKAAPLLKIALNTHAERLLTYCARHGVAITSEAFRDLELHPQAGTRAKKQLLDLALIEEERITIRRGRGSTAVAIRPTASGYERAGIKRHGTRGGDSIQHEFLVRALAQRITDARIDARAGTKACDLLIPYNSAHHAQLTTILTITPAEGALIAIEVEVSNPDRTATRNIARNTEAGVAHTIIATTTPLRRKMPGAVIVDVFALLEALGGVV